CYATGILECVSGGTVDTCVEGSQTGNDDNCNGIDENCNGIPDDNSFCLSIGETNISNIIIITDTYNILLESDIIGIFDSSAITNEDCNNIINGELLVGSSQWLDEISITIDAIGSEDNCDISGQLFPGFVENNEMLLKLIRNDQLYMVDYVLLLGSNTFGENEVTRILNIIALH
ncbi:MAG: hypothetical protein HQ521_01460, partial [Bacteroidetes bacterium]|nr:hypothetical protein [Bacteroidota bacterium]